jgi:WD40 repeat protein
MLSEVGDFVVTSQHSSKSVLGSINTVRCESVTRRYALAVTDRGGYFAYDIWTSSVLFSHTVASPTCLTDASWIAHDFGIFCTSSYDHSLRLYDTRRPDQLLLKPLDLGYSVHCCDFNARAPIVAAGLEDGRCRLWDMRSLVNLHELSTTFDDDVRAVQWCPTSEFVIVIGDTAGRLLFFGVRHEREPYFFRWWKRAVDDDDTSGAHKFPIVGLAFSENGRILYSLDAEGHLREWDVDLGLSTMQQTNLGMAKGIHRKLGICICEGDVIVPVKNSVQKVHSGQSFVGHLKNVFAVSTHSDGFVSAGADAVLPVWKHRDASEFLEDKSDWSD